MSVLSAPPSFGTRRAAPAGRAGRPARRKIARAYLNLAIVTALTPVFLMLVAGLGVSGGLMTWDRGFAYAAAVVAPAIALCSIGTGIVGLVLAVALGLGRFWLRALLALSISAATLAGYIASHGDPLAPDAAGPQLRT